MSIAFESNGKTLSRSWTTKESSFTSWENKLFFKILVLKPIEVVLELLSSFPHIVKYKFSTPRLTVITVWWNISSKKSFKSSEYCLSHQVAYELRRALKLGHGHGACWKKMANVLMFVVRNPLNGKHPCFVWVFITSLVLFFLKRLSFWGLI